MAKTKIVVLKLKKLLRYVIPAAIVLILFLLMLLFFSGDKKNPDGGSGTITPSPSPTPAAASYRAGKYSSVLTVGDATMNLEVLVDTDRVKAVRLSYLDESMAVMYPLFAPAAEDIGEQLAAGTAFDDLELYESSRYTQTLLISEIKKTLQKALLSNDLSDSDEK